MSALLSLIGWSFLPGLVSSWVQTIYYGITIRAGDPKPQAGTPRYAQHRRRIHILVVAAYLLYTIYEADHDLRRKSTYYADLGLPISSTENQVKSRFRRLAALHHPDKTSAEEAAESANVFIHLKLASDTLQDAAKRFAYQRFGDAINSWEKCVTIKDFVTQGLLYNTLPHYSVAAATIYLLGLFGYFEFAKFYRWLILVALCLMEVHIVTRPAFPPLLNAVNAFMTRVAFRDAYLPFQFIALLRKLVLTVYIALSQIGPLLVQGAGPKGTAAAHDEKSLRENLTRLETLSKQLDADAARLMDMEVAPFKGDSASVHNLQSKMREWLVQNTIRADPMVRDAMGRSYAKRRIDAPSGAKGNR
ncbi:Heat shock protein DnaJ [Metarhizium album ARSEF 1941]|uniref:Heat shock protein DnaJ n=1 Tax=Metarhizium album (strain ARSEF 1941) TaxID=1081103 RepID=A0A0B2X186_METAS|nr:Heat shock protein DnaJ [Metarhizium album ARSEF 1941]KHN99432.1 Heat shock protein DnaJ [Metarhizium album ARSEF 1941]